MAWPGVPSAVRQPSVLSALLEGSPQLAPLSSISGFSRITAAILWLAEPSGQGAELDMRVCGQGVSQRSLNLFPPPL